MQEQSNQSNPKDIIAANLTNRRQQLGLSQRELGEAIGQNRHWIHKREYGEASIDFEDVQLLAEALQIEDPFILLQPNAFRYSESFDSAIDAI